MDRSHPPFAENKLLLLHILDHMGAMTDMELTRLTMENGLMDYLDERLALSELKETGLVDTLPAGEDLRYLMTAKGVEALRQFRDRIPASRLDEVTALCRTWRGILRKERQVYADYQMRENGCNVRLRLREDGVDLIALSLEVGDVKQAQAICKRWRADPSTLYQGVIAALLAPF